jgi:hypothetical protein
MCRGSTSLARSRYSCCVGSSLSGSASTEKRLITGAQWSFIRSREMRAGSAGGRSNWKHDLEAVFGPRDRRVEAPHVDEIELRREREVLLQQAKPAGGELRPREHRAALLEARGAHRGLADLDALGAGREPAHRTPTQVLHHPQHHHGADLRLAVQVEPDPVGVKDRRPPRLVRLELHPDGGHRRLRRVVHDVGDLQRQEVDVRGGAEAAQVPSTGLAASSVLRATRCRVRRAPATGVNSTMEHAGSVRR